MQWNCKGSFVKSSLFEDRTCFAGNNLWLTLNLKHVYIDVCCTIVFSPLARQGVPACLCIFVSRYV